MLDLAIIGAGPAALSAALYAARSGLKVTVFERASVGGELNLIFQLSNYPGFSGSGQDLAQTLRDQAVAAGAKVEYGECSRVVIVEPTKDTPRHFQLTLDETSVSARSVLVATGSEPRQLDFTLDVPVSYCALCDLGLVRGEEVAVIGGGNSAAQEALLLAPEVKSLTLMTHSALKADHCLREKLQSCPNCQIREHFEADPATLNRYDRVFVFIGKCPATRFLEALEPRVLAADGAIVTAANGYETAIPGLFAAGDVRQGSIHQVITAAGEGAAAAIEISKKIAQSS